MIHLFQITQLYAIYSLCFHPRWSLLSAGGLCTISAHPYSGSAKINFVQALLCNSFISCSHITKCHKMYATETNGFWGFFWVFSPCRNGSTNCNYFPGCFAAPIRWTGRSIHLCKTPISDPLVQKSDLI